MPKKYSYIDRLEIELKYNNPPDKKFKQRGKYDAGSYYVGDPSFYELFEDAPNVEVSTSTCIKLAVTPVPRESLRNDRHTCKL